MPITAFSVLDLNRKFDGATMALIPVLYNSADDSFNLQHPVSNTIKTYANRSEFFFSYSKPVSTVTNQDYTTTTYMLIFDESYVLANELIKDMELAARTLDLTRFSIQNDNQSKASDSAAISLLIDHVLQLVGLVVP